MANNDSDFKILFLNVRTLSEQKLKILISILILTYSIIFINEVNYKQKYLDDLPTDIGQYHYDERTPRLGMICRQSINFKYNGPGLIIDQERSFTDKTCVQTNFYTFSVSNYVFDIENVYVLPETNATNTKILKEFLTDRANSTRPYISGGDFNINWKKTTARKTFQIPTAKQLVTGITRISKYTTVRTNRTRISKTQIDLIFANFRAQNKIAKSEIWNNETLKDGTGKKYFDHFGVDISLDLLIQKPYRDVRIPRDPLRRPDPSPEERILINADIAEMCATCPDDYNLFFMKLKSILDKYIPNYRCGGFYTKRFYDCPYPGVLRDEISLKHKLEVKYRKNPTPENKTKKNKQRNKVTEICREFRTTYATQRLDQANSVKSIQKTIEFLSKKRAVTKPKQMILINDKCCEKLANEMSDYFKIRAEGLIKIYDIERSSGLHNAINQNEIPETKLELKHFPAIQNLHDVIPKSKVTKSGSFDTISSYIITLFWPSMADKLNTIFTKNLNFPVDSQGYYQRIISKSAVKQPLEFKDMRPLGILNVFPKYRMSKYVWTEIRQHVQSILKKRRVYTYHGCRAPIYLTFDKIKWELWLGHKVILTKFDFSNAFGTLYKNRLLQILEQLNLGDEVIKFCMDYFTNQGLCQTIFEDPVFGIFVSDLTKMMQGGPQGQCGMDVAFTILQFGLSAMDDIFRNYYMDDLNDIICRCLTEQAAVNLAINNDINLNKQAISVGFKKNEKKTTFIPFNVSTDLLLTAKIEEKYIKTNTDILGVGFTAKKNGVCIKPAADDFISGIQQKIHLVHTSRAYVDAHERRVKIARTIVYNQIGNLPLIYVYGESDTNQQDSKSGLNKQFERCLVKINDVFRATGLRQDTPKHILDKCMGCNIEQFCKDSVIIDGLKALEFENLDPFGRQSKIKPNGAFYGAIRGTFKNKFMRLWNLLEQSDRESFRTMRIEQVKAVFKKRRKLTYESSIYDTYEWRSLNQA